MEKRDCPYCIGTGRDPYTVYGAPCRVCKGKGVVYKKPGETPCKYCNSTGRDPYSIQGEPCRVCKGLGAILLSDKKFSIKEVHKSSNSKKQYLISILFLVSDPSNASRLRIGEELREIQENLQRAKLRDKFDITLRASVRARDLTQALLDKEPRIVHFSGHGTSEGKLCIETDVGTAHFVSAAAIGNLFRQFNNHVECVILNACYSKGQANAIVRHIPFVVGMSSAISDKAAIAFSIGFYQGLGAGRSIEKAFELGCTQIQLHSIPGHLIPVLFKK